MGYLKIPNLYKDQRILQFKRVYALEKVHGTSAHIAWGGPDLGIPFRLFSGGASYEAFAALFDAPTLEAKFRELCHGPVTIYGEAYGGKLQGMSSTYGKELRFIAFDVQGGDRWMDVEAAASLVERLDLEFVPYCLVKTDLESLDYQRDLPSEVAGWRDLSGAREGVVLRPPFEVTLNNGERLIAKHKSPAFGETKTPREVNPDKQVALDSATAVAEEWVTPMRLAHVLDKLQPNETRLGMESTGQVIQAIVQDVLMEGAGEVEDTKDNRKAIGARAARLFKASLNACIGGTQ